MLAFRYTSALAATVALFSISSCSKREATRADVKEEGSADGAVALALELADATVVGAVTFVLERDGVEVRSGQLELDRDGRASGLITGLQPGAHRVHLRADRTSLDGGSVGACLGSADFLAAAGATTFVSVAVLCDDPGVGGAIQISGSFNSCPRLGSSSVTPARQMVGRTIALQASASDRDGQLLSYSWQSGPASSMPTMFSSFGSGAQGQFTCTSPGTYLLRVSVRDGACETVLERPFEIECVSTQEGDASIGCGSSPPFDCAPGCLTDYIPRALCDGGVWSCPPGTRPIEAGECPCGFSGLPPNCPCGFEFGCHSSGRWLCLDPRGTSAPEGGTPVVSALDVPVPDGGVGCDDRTACQVCAALNCTNVGGADLYGQCSDPQCRDVLACVERTAEPQAPSIEYAYCGTRDVDVCLASDYDPSGPCRALIEAGLDTTDRSVVAARYVDPAYPAGRALDLARCEIEFCRDPCFDVR